MTDRIALLDALSDRIEEMTKGCYSTEQFQKSVLDKVEDDIEKLSKSRMTQLDIMVVTRLIETAYALGAASEE